MRTTVDLPDDLFDEVKAVAVQRGISLKTLIRSAVEVEIRKETTKVKRRVTFPLLPSSEPGALDLSNAEIEDLLA